MRSSEHNIIPEKPNAPESWRKLAALHRELSRLCGSPTYFLAYRDAARVFDGMRYQEAYAITGGKVPDKLETSPLEGRKTLIPYYGHERELKRLESGSDTTS